LLRGVGLEKGFISKESGRGSNTFPKGGRVNLKKDLDSEGLY